jgi:PDZ domain of MCC-2 bdg protein for Usher syndrome
VEHLKSQNRVLSLALEEAKSTCDSLTELLAKYESNNTALQLSLSYCDSMIESYDVLVALLETQSSSLLSSDDGGGRGGRCGNDNSRHVNRKRAETVARHLLARAEKESSRRADSGLGVISSPSHLDSTWEDSSGTVPVRVGYRLQLYR